MPGQHSKRLSTCALLQVTHWFTDSLNYEYDPLVHGNTAEWLSDLVSISFDEPPKYFKRSMRCIRVTPIPCIAHDREGMPAMSQM